MQTCPKCSYTRKPVETVPDWQCPSCGIAYAKFGQGAASASALPIRDSDAAEPTSHSRSFLIALVVAVLAIGYFGSAQLGKSRGADASRNLGQAGSEVHETNNPAVVMTMDPGGPALRLKPETAEGLAKFTQARVVMFGTSWCPYTAQAREWLAAKGVSYVEFDIERDHPQAQFHKDVLRASGVPTLVIGNRLVDGFDEGQIAAGLKEL